MYPRHVILPASGTLLVNTDLHGNGADWNRMRDQFLRSPADTQWVILGDIVHGPNEQARAQRPDLYDYEDESGRIAVEIMRLRRKFPRRVHFVLGNHDWAHIGGPITRKFWPDEVSYLESFLEPLEQRAIDTLFREALLCVIAPCGAFLCHASPATPPQSLAELDGVPLGQHLDRRETSIVEALTMPYGQKAADSRRFLSAISGMCGHELRMVIHGHDRHEAGWFNREDTQVCPVIFGAARPYKRVLKLDLARRYETVYDLRDGHEIVRLWGRW